MTSVVTRTTVRVVAEDLDEQAERDRRRRVRFWVVVAIVVAIMAGVLIHNSGEHDAAYGAGDAWAKAQLAAGYAAANPDDPDPCDDQRAVHDASAGYNFTSWYSGCESATGR